MNVNKMPDSPIGAWMVTTEGDEEGRTTRQLGVWYGHIVDIAKMLAKRRYYSLRFQAVESPPVVTGDKETGAGIVQISLDISSGTWDMSRDDRVRAFKELLGKGVTLTPWDCRDGDYYASVKLIYSPPLEDENEDFVG